MVLDFVVYGFTLPIICILIASKGLPQQYVGLPVAAAQLTIRQNGFIIYQSYVSPGAFEITDLHPTSSNGDLDVTIDERDGNQQNYTIPYSTVPILQREGRFKFDLTAGDFRSGNSQQSSPFFFQGTVLWRFTTGICCLRRDAMICQLHRHATRAGARPAGTGAQCRWM